MAELRFPELERLPELFSELRRFGFQLEPTHRLAAEDLLARLLVDNANPPDKKVWGQYLAPVLCRTPEQQRQFRQLFNYWINPLSTPTLEERVVDPVPQTRIGKVPTWKPALAAILAVVLGSLIVWWTEHFWTPEAPGSIPETTIKTEILTPHPLTGSPTGTGQPHQAIRPIPLRIPQVPGLSAEREGLMLWLLVLSASLPWLVWLGWLVYRLVWRQVILKQTKTDSGNPFDRLTLALNARHPFALARWMAPLRSAYREPTRRLDATATLGKTLRKGLFSPVVHNRTRRPLYLVLIDRGSTQDHRASLALALVRQMHNQGVWVEAFEFYRDPRWCYPLSGGSQGLELTRLLGAYPEARLVVTGDASGCFHPITGAAYPVLDWLSALSYRVWLTTRSAPWGRVEAGLAASGFVVAPLNGEGMAAVSTWLQAPKPGLVSASAEEKPLPPSLRRERDRWLRERPQPQAEVQRLLRELRHYLGAEAYLLLGACATYPQMVGNLAIALDQLLIDQSGPQGQDGRAREQRLLQLARLPWSQEGVMPGYLRKALLQDLKAEAPRIAEAYLKLLNEASISQLPQALAMPFTANPQERIRSLRRRLTRWLPHAPRNSALADSLFAQVLLSGRRGLLDFLLPQTLAKRLPGIRWGWRPVLLSMALAALAQTACALVWWRIEEPVRQWQVRQMRESFAEFPVVIHHSQDQAAHARLLQRYLEERGFPQVEQRPAGPEQNAFSISGPAVAEEAISVVAALVSYLRYGESYPVNRGRENDDPDNKIHIVWVEPVKPLSVFRDPLVNPFNPEQWQVELANLQKQIAAESVKPDTEETAGNSEITVEPPQEKQIHILQDTHEKEGFPGPRMVIIPAGEFLMGSPESEPDRENDEGPQHKVTIAAFALGETEVTFAEYDRYAKMVGANWPEDREWGRDQRPVINVSWDEAVAYARWLSDQTGAEYRLPSEAEWEYAARAGTNTPFNTGNCINSQQANFDTTTQYGSCFTETLYSPRTTETGNYPPNAFGLKDMHGNVWEWTEDCWHESYKGAPESGGPWLHEQGGECNARVLRGGSWRDRAKFLRSAFRFGDLTIVKNDSIGFRLARTLQPEEIPAGQSAEVE